jgi:hypothetical protein
MADDTDLELRGEAAEEVEAEIVEEPASEDFPEPPRASAVITMTNGRTYFIYGDITAMRAEIDRAREDHNAAMLMTIHDTAVELNPSYMVSVEYQSPM